jgi:hypothetical protein
MQKEHAALLITSFILAACSSPNQNTTVTDTDTLTDPSTGTLTIPEGAKRVSAATYIFEDDFEESEDTSFWGGSGKGSAYANFGAEDITDSSNRVLAFNYTLQSDGSHAWSQKDFHLPQVTEVSFLYRLYTPTDYTDNESGNQKLISTWSGEYGIFNEGLHIASEMWNTNDGSGKKPSMYIGVNPLGTDGDNRGHTYRSEGNEKPAVEWQDGQWHDMYIYMKAAPVPGEYGSFEIWRDGIKLISTDDDLSTVTGSWWVENHQSPSELISYSEGNNFVEYGYLMGWWNKSGISDTVTFQIDDITVNAK